MLTRVGLALAATVLALACDPGAEPELEAVADAPSSPGMEPWVELEGPQPQPSPTTPQLEPSASAIELEPAPNDDAVESEPEPIPAPEPSAIFACPHRTLRSACNEFESLSDWDDDDPQECRHDDRGKMPDGATRYHIIRRMWSGTRQAQLLVLESNGCFRYMGVLSWNTPMSEISTYILATWSETIDLDQDGQDEIAFRVAQEIEDASVYPITSFKTRVSRYCRARGGGWECTETMKGRPSVDDWPSMQP